MDDIKFNDLRRAIVREDNGEISERMYQKRKELGITQVQVADALFISETTLKNLEMGIWTMTVHQAITIAQLYNVTLDWLLLGK